MLLRNHVNRLTLINVHAADRVAPQPLRSGCQCSGCQRERKPAGFMLKNGSNRNEYFNLNCYGAN